MGKNAFLEQQKAREQAWFDIGFDIAFQQAFDFICCVLHDKSIMGNDTFGRDRMIKIMHGMRKYKEHFDKAYSTKYIYADHLQEELDGLLREIFGDDMDSFETRYPQLRKITYK